MTKDRGVFKTRYPRSARAITVSWMPASRRQDSASHTCWSGWRGNRCEIIRRHPALYVLRVSRLPVGHRASGFVL